MATPATRALAEGRMVAGLTPDAASRSSRPRATSRGKRIQELRQRERAIAISRESYAELLHLEELERRSRSKLSRRMARRRAFGIGKTVRAIKARRRRPDAPPLRLGNRIPRGARQMLLREEGRPLSGRQWKQLRKAARRQERAS